jgi:methylmalonyl-CoA mutase C-terminal domain/subunit
MSPPEIGRITAAQPKAKTGISMGPRVYPWGSIGRYHPDLWIRRNFMGERKIRILLAKLGEGHKGSQLNLAKRFGDAGFEVIFTELQEPDAIAFSALQESVDHIGITTLPGAVIESFEKIRSALKRYGMEDVTITAGGFLEDVDLPKIEEIGVKKFFPAGTPIEALIEWSKENIKPRED